MRKLPCFYPNCPSTFLSQRGRTYHVKTKHRVRQGLRPRTPEAQDPAPEPDNQDLNGEFEASHPLSISSTIAQEPAQQAFHFLGNTL